MMPHKPSHVANAFLERGKLEGVAIDHLKLQKLVYFLHGWHLATLGSPAVSDMYEAWPYGPVLQSLYDEFKKNGRAPIRDYAIDIDPKTGEAKALKVGEDARFYEIFDKVWNRYKRFTGLYMSQLTHAPGTPWSKAREAGRSFISNEEIRDHFVGVANANG